MLRFVRSNVVGICEWFGAAFEALGKVLEQVMVMRITGE